VSLDLYITGPGFDASCRLAPGEPALVLGRDADCPICLPDPQKSVSRRHLSVWYGAGALQFEVLSVVNGVDVDGAEFPPGARGRLAPGQVLTLAGYRITVASVAEPARSAAAADPWAEFEREAAQLVASVSATGPVEEDPFGDWGFQSTFAPGAPADALPGEPAPDVGMASFFTGLGLAGVQADNLTQGELEAMGRLTRSALQGLLQALQAGGGTRRPAGSEDRSAPEQREVNPLRMDTPLESKLWYLFGGQAAAAGCIPPDRAVGELVAQLLAHEQATGEAMRQALEGVLDAFAPDALKARLLSGGPKLFESARAWDAFARDYAEQSRDREAWVRQLLERHFAEAYAQALQRAKRHTGGPPRG
jgi:predicted component of type VI protein secretion system